MSRLALIAIFVSAAAVFASLSAFTLVSATHSNNLIGLLAIDANVQGNTATSIGSIDGCARVEPGAQIDVDYVVDAVPEDRPIIAFEVDIRYNPELLEIAAVNYDLMLAAVGDYQPFVDLTDVLPDTDGSYHLVVLDTASQTAVPEYNQPELNVERGKGVIARITLRAKAPGLSEVTIGYDPPQGPYPLTQDTQNETIIVDKIGGASIAVGQDCPPAAIAPLVIDPPNTEAEIFAGVPAVVVAPPEPNPDQGRALPSADSEPADGIADPIPVDAATNENANPSIDAAGVTTDVDGSTDAKDTPAVDDRPHRKDATKKTSPNTDLDAVGPEQNSQLPGGDGVGAIAWVLGGFAVALALCGGIIFLVVRKAS